MLTRQIEANWTVLTLPGRFWKWRMRGAAPYFRQAHSEVLDRDYDVVLATSFVALAELRGLAPRLSTATTHLYFHENQFAYPVRFPREWDTHYAVTQLTSALAADHCHFNSVWNRDSFLAGARDWLRKMPDAHPPGWLESIARKSEILPVPMELSASPVQTRLPGPPVLLWNHRWEFDKAPEVFFEALYALAGEGVDFRVIVCGQRFRKAPECFEEARSRLGERILHWGFAESRSAYEGLLQRADIAVSTALHEFFGVAMLEAAHFGAYPLVPDRLSYPEIFPAEYRYPEGALLPRLRALCSRDDLRMDRRALTEPYGAALVARYRDLIWGSGADGGEGAGHDQGDQVGQ